MKKINYIVEEIADQYCDESDNNCPWVIGFSGGKDSTVMLTLTWLALLKIRKEFGNSKLNREVFVVCNDTMVENPIITNYVNKVLEKITDAAVKHSLPIKVRKTIPRLEDSFWVNLIGKGYPAPNNAFRWCTERLKIRPTSRFITELVFEQDDDKPKEAIILVGTRKSESATRAKSIKKHEIKGKRLSKHPLQNNVLVYSPIKELALEEVWYIINTFESPWGADNTELFNIYADASADDYECPTMVSNDEHKSCGQSRFGCWTCTVVKKDKSISAQIDNGIEWLRPLQVLRDWIQEERNNPDNREIFRRNGTLAQNEMGVVKFNHRAEILEKVFEAQKMINDSGIEVELINNQELIAIQVIWFRDLYFELKVSDIYNKVFNKNLDMDKHNELLRKEEELLLSACEDSQEHLKLIQDLLKLEKSKTLMRKRRGLLEDIENRYNQLIKS